MCRWHIATAVARPQARNPTGSAKKNLTFVCQDKCEVFQRNESLAGFVKCFQCGNVWLGANFT